MRRGSERFCATGTGLCLAILSAILICQGAAQDFQVTDIFGRSLNQRGITLVDWDGYMANPAIKVRIQAPRATSYPVNATISANGPRLYFGLPSTTSPDGPSVILSFADAATVKDLLISIFPDRDGNDEDYHLRLFNGPGQESLIPIHVIDQDRPHTNAFAITVDFSQDKTGFFGDPQKRAIIQQAAGDWAYFIDDMKLDSVPMDAEQTWIWSTNGFTTGTYTRNREDYNGFLLYAYGFHSSALRSGGEGSFGGGFQQRNGISLGLRRSGGFEAETAGNYNTLGWFLTQSDDDWAYTGNLGQEANDLYSIAHHEIGHALFFNTAHTTFQQFKNAGQISTPEILAYHGGPARIDSSDHFNGEIDDASRKGVFGYEYYGDVPRKRWLITKLDLLCIKALGYSIRPISAMMEFSLGSKQFVRNAVVGHPYNSHISATGGIPVYYFKLAQGVLPPGLVLDSFTGTVSGTPQNAGEYPFTIEGRDYTTNGQSLTIPLSIKVTSAVEFKFVPETTTFSNEVFFVSLEGALDARTVLEATTDFVDWSAIATNETVDPPVQFQLNAGQFGPTRFFRARSIP